MKVDALLRPVLDALIAKLRDNVSAKASIEGAKLEGDVLTISLDVKLYLRAEEAPAP